MSRQDDTISAKIAKQRSLEEACVSAHPYSFDKSHTVGACRESMGESVQTAGRITSKREHGKVTFLTLADHSGTIQVMVKEDVVGTVPYRQLVEYIDASDYLGVTGKVVKSRTEEITIEADTFQILSKALRAVPTAFGETEDKEFRFRKRYLDMLISPQVRKVLDARWTIEKEIRRYLQDVHQFIEVETPVLQPLYGGTNAKPFMTHMNALDSNFFLRIAPELYLKRLIVGGYERIFEIARNFRNEGIDQTHQPEFTMMEWYMAYTDYNGVMDVAEGLLKHLSSKVHGAPDLSGDWPRIRMVDAIQKYLSLDVEQIEDGELQTELQNRGLEMTGSFSRGKAIYALFDKLVTPNLIDPTWIIDYPKEVSPLSKLHRKDDRFVERFELYVGTKEISDGWSEITDALDQRARFENEQKNMREGDEEAQPTDEDFLEAMEYGMPPLGGIGIGIDRLVMFLTNTWSIKEVIAFPTLRPTPWQLAMSEKMLGHQTKLTVASKDASKPVGIYTSAQYSIDPFVLRDFAGIFFAYTIIRGVKIVKRLDSLEQKKNEVFEDRKGITVEEIADIKPIHAYRELFKATKVDLHSQRPSPEALLRRIASGKGIYNINTAVDAYNLAVVETGVGLGGFNFDKLNEPVVLRYSRAGERMLLLGDDSETILEDNHLVYSDKNQPITMDLNYRDIAQTKITENTTDVILFADGAPGLSRHEIVSALRKGAEYIQEYCGGSIDEIQVIDTDSIGEALSSKTQINITRENAWALVQSLVKNPNLQSHMIAVESAMMGLWEYFEKSRPSEVKETKESWGTIGLLHDADWELTENEPHRHTVLLTEKLHEMGVSDEWMESIRTHNADHIENHRGPHSLMEWSLYACDHMTGIIVACALVSPDKKLANVTLERVMKKFKEKSFAKGATREEPLKGAEELGIDLETLARVCLEAIQQNALAIGL